MTTKSSGHLTESEKEVIDDYLTGNREIIIDEPIDVYAEDEQ